MDIRDLNSIVSTSRKASMVFSGETKKAPAKQPGQKSAIAAKLTAPITSKKAINAPKHDNETKYAVIGGATVLGTIALAIVNREKVLKLFGKEKNHLKRYLKPAMIERRYAQGIYGGPDIDLTGGPKALHKAWSSYIKEIETNRKNNADVFKRLRDAFAENPQKADDLEALAQKRLERRGGIWA